MADKDFITTEHIEVEINSLELVEFMEELSQFQFVKTNLINESSEKELQIPTSLNQIKEEITSYVENDYEEPIFDPIDEETEYKGNFFFRVNFLSIHCHFFCQFT